MSMDATSNKQHTRSEEETNVSAARMQRTLRTIRALKCLGYQNSACVRECKCDELPCPLLTWLVTELWAACPELQGRRGDVVLMGELRDLLDKLFCPVTLLSADIPGPVLFNQVSEFLVSELQAAHILRYKALNPEDQTVKEGEAQKDQRVQDPYDDRPEDEYGDDEDTSSTRKEQTQAEVTLLIEDLHLDTASQFTDIIHEVESKLSLLPCGDMAEPLLQSNLNSTQWRQIKKLNAALLEDYQCRRQMMIKRFEVTLQSFAWGEGNQKERSDALASVPPIASLCLSSRVSLPLLLAAREDQSCILPVKAGPSTAVHKVLMGSVPDRGGRPGEIEPPMPVWEGRRKGTAKSARGGGGRNQQQQRKKERTRKGRRESKSPE